MAKKEIILKNELKRGLFKDIPESDRPEEPVKNDAIKSIDSKAAKRALRDIEREDLTPAEKQDREDTIMKWIENEVSLSNDQNSKKLFEEYYNVMNNFDKKSEIEQIKLLSHYNQRGRFSEFMLGGMCKTIKDGIFNGTIKNYNSWYDFMEKKESLVGFSRTTADRYIKVYESVTIQQFERLGVSKAFTVASIEDPEEREKIIDLALDTPNLKDRDIQELVATVKDEKRKEKQDEKKKEIKKIIKTVVYNQTIDENTVVLQPVTFSIELMLEALDHFDLSIKAYIKRRFEEGAK